MFDIPKDKSFGDVEVHATAIVAPGAELGRGVVIGPFSTIGPHVKLHDGVVIGSHCVVEGRTTVGSRTVVYSHATLGSAPQDLKFANEESSLEIGSANSIRQYVNMSLGTAGGDRVTRVGSGNLFMVYTHIGHDSVVADDCVFANGVSLAGHVTVDDGAIIGGHSAIHQFCRIGKLAFAAGGAMITQDVPPYCLVHGNRAAVNGLNVVGLRRKGVSASNMQDVKTMYKILFKENMTIDDCVLRIKAEIPESEYKSEFLEFLAVSKRGVCR